jgi:hypothetical protein
LIGNHHIDQKNLHALKERPFMSSNIINRITKITDAEQIGKEFVYNDVKQVRFDSDANYASIAEAAAEINDEVSDRLVVWGCGVSDDGCPQVAIQRFESIDPDDVDSIDTFESSPGASSGAAVKRFFSTSTDGN